MSLDHIRIVLVEITHPGNIGAAARAMKTMGLSRLVLVKPKLFPCAEATARAAGADDLLMNAQLFDNYEESIKDCHLVLGTSARTRSISWPLLTPRECAAKALAIQGEIAIVFGREHSGLTNQELDFCHYMIQIPTNPHFTSLNVASAVQILAYELKMTSDELMVAQMNASTENPSWHSLPASTESVALFYQHLEQTLMELEFLRPEKSQRLMRRLQRLFNRTQLIDSEVKILRGVLTAIQRKL
jgi:TrmH family RNA methyltransferase